MDDKNVSDNMKEKSNRIWTFWLRLAVSGWGKKDEKVDKVEKDDKDYKDYKEERAH